MDRLHWIANSNGTIAGVAFGDHYVVDKYTHMHNTFLKWINVRIMNYQGVYSFSAILRRKSTICYKSYGLGDMPL